MSRRAAPDGATLYDFRDIELMMRVAEEANGSGGVSTVDLADALGFGEGEGGRPVGMRLAWMRKYGMVILDENARTWSLSASGRRVVAAHERSTEIEIIDRLPDEAMVDVMAHVTSRYRHGQGMLAHLLRREFLYGTAKR